MIKIKKYYIAVMFAAMVLYPGYYLLQIFWESMVRNGLVALIQLILFLIGLVFSINFWSNYYFRAKLAKEVADELMKEKLKNEPEFFDNMHVSPQYFKNDIENHLLKKMENEEYIFWKKKV